MHCEVITKIKLIDIRITSHSYCIFVVGPPKINSLNKFQVYNTMLSIATMLQIRPPELIHSMWVNLYTLWTIPSHLSYSPDPGKHLPIPCLWVQMCYIPWNEIMQHLSFYVWLSLLITTSSRFIHSCMLSQMAGFWGG